MSVPLDRLYNFLHGVCNHDVIIYRWNPHGSKKLDDLTPVDDRFSRDRVASMTTPIAIMHDQEPLDFNLWSKEDFFQYWCTMNPERAKECHQKGQDSKRIEYEGKLHLRSIAGPSSNLYNYVLLVHSEQNSSQIQKYQQHDFLPVYYWSHAIIAADWFRYAAHDPLLEYNCKNIKYDFLIYNRAWSGTREYRLTFSKMLVEHNLVNQCLTTFSHTDNGQYYTEHIFKNPRLAVNLTNLHQRFQPNQHLSCASADYNNQDYQTTGIEIVLETLFDDTRWHLTEKALRPIACGKPFMLASSAGSLQYLRNYGFETFGNYINEDYDQISDPHKRLQSIVLEMQRISSLSDAEKKSLWEQLHVVAKRNQQHFFSKDWQHSIIQEFCQNLDSAMTIMNQNCTGAYWRGPKALPPAFRSSSRDLVTEKIFETYLKLHN